MCHMMWYGTGWYGATCCSAVPYVEHGTWNLKLGIWYWADNLLTLGLAAVWYCHRSCIPLHGLRFILFGDVLYSWASNTNLDSGQISLYDKYAKRECSLTKGEIINKGNRTNNFQSFYIFFTMRMFTDFCFNSLQCISFFTEIWVTAEEKIS